MLIRQPPLITEIERHTCDFHKRNPGQQFAGCTCGVTYRTRMKPMEDWTPKERADYLGSWHDTGL